MKSDRVRALKRHSFSEPEKVSIWHIDLYLDIHFDTETIFGQATLHLHWYEEGPLILDTHGLEIKKVTIGQSYRETEYLVGDYIEGLGRPLSIMLPPGEVLVHVTYEASGQAGALQWLKPCQTSGSDPFLFTQSQTIGARTWIPCQDTPSVRATYHARVKTPERLTALMSAENPGAKNADKIYEFSCRYPIPSYLFALVVGNLEYRTLGPRSGVYAEPTVISKAAWEFNEVEGMIAAAESLYGPYRWRRFDLVVLPPSFPLGGMENPQLVFVTPTLLTGDRSLTSLLAHELAHSWSGNLVTNATWNDFWLNEGFSVYAEHRIMERLYGKDYDDMLALLRLRGLNRALVTLEPRDTWLQLDLSGRHPDECFTEIPYEKGYLFLRVIEETVGREKWDRFLDQYFNTFAFSSVASSEFLSFLNEQLSRGDQELGERIAVNAWVYGPGLPENCPRICSSELEKVDSQIREFENGIAASDLKTEGWTAHHWVYFLSNLSKPLAEHATQDLDKAFAFCQTDNAEIMYTWLLLCIASQYKRADATLEKFLQHYGRMKYIKGLYCELIKTDEGKNTARRIYKVARPIYHSAVVRIVDELLAN